MARKKSDFEFRRWGTEFKDGKLFDFAKNHVFAASAWPNPRAWIKRRSHGWQCTRLWGDKVLSDELRTPGEYVMKRPEGEPYRPPWAEYVAERTDKEKARDDWFKKRDALNKQNIAKYMEPVPKDVRAMIGEYADRNWHVMNLFARCPGSEDLHHSNPALVLALANSWSFQKDPVKRPMRAARGLVHKKQKHILEWMGFPATESFRKILAKIPPDCLYLKDLLYLRHWSSDERVLKLLSHLDRINEAVIYMVTSEQRLRALTPQLLAEVSRITHRYEMDYQQGILNDYFTMRRRVMWQECPQRFTSLARLKAVHDELVDRINRLAPNDLADYPADFPDPPYRGTANIWPIMTPDDLYHEGCKQRNCVASRAYSVAAGGEYIYRIYHPVRATLSVAKGACGWEVREILAACNRDVPEDVRESLTAALYSSGQYVAPVEKVPAEDDEVEIFDDAQLPLGMTPEAMALIARVETCFGRSQKIEMALPAERMSA